jgi:hypothetical protein
MDVKSVYRQPAPQPAQAVKKADEARSSARQANENSEAQARTSETQRTQQPQRPVVNTQGQSTGRLVNTTA